MIKIKLLSLAALVCCTRMPLSAQQSNLAEDYSKYMPEVRAMNKLLFHLPPSPSALTKEGLDKARAGLNASGKVSTVLKPIIQNITGPGGDIPLYIYKPDTVLGVVLDIHGGGWSTGSPVVDAQINDVMARTCHVAVVSVDYRLAPETPLAGSIADCEAAAKWLVENGEKEFGTTKLFVSGNSAGAHLAAVTTLYIRDSLKAINRVKGVNFVYGVYDLGRTPSSRMVTDTSFLPKNMLDDVWRLVFGHLTPEQRQQPVYSPLYADLHNLPPALFTVGAVDPLADDTYFMEVRWRMAGNRTYLAVYPESPHGLDIFPTQLAKVARDKMHQWITGLIKQ